MYPVKWAFPGVGVFSPNFSVEKLERRKLRPIWITLTKSRDHENKTYEKMLPVPYSVSMLTAPDESTTVSNAQCSPDVTAKHGNTERSAGTKTGDTFQKNQQSLNFFSTRMFCDGSEITLQEFAWIWNFKHASAVWMLFFAKKAHFDFCFVSITKGLKTVSGHVSWVSSWSNFASVVSEFPPAWCRLGAAAKCVFGEARLSRGAYLSPEIWCWKLHQ